MYDFLFVVLVYRNVNDLSDFFESNNVLNSKVIVVNSFYDIESENQFRQLAINNNADFLSVLNKGYGYGNNVGCEYAINNYKFKYLIISNADILIKKLSVDLLPGTDALFAPQIINAKGKNQNPNIPFRPLYIEEKLQNYAYKSHKRYILKGFNALSRLKKILFYIMSPFMSKKEIYSPHGAFIIVPHDIICTYYPLFNEEMFLYCEELHLAKLMKQNNIKIRYVPNVVIFHKEDGSISLETKSNYKYARESFITYYKYWYECK